MRFLLYCTSTVQDQPIELKMEQIGASVFTLQRPQDQEFLTGIHKIPWQAKKYDIAHLHSKTYTQNLRWSKSVKRFCLVSVKCPSIPGVAWCQRNTKSMTLTLNFEGQGHGQGKIKCLHSRAGVQSICLHFVSWQSNHFWPRYGEFHVWPSKFKVKVMTKVKSNAPILGLESNRYVCFSSMPAWPWKLTNDLENW